MSAVDRLPGRHYSVHDDTMQGLADAVRYRTGSWGGMTPPEMIEELNGPYFERYDMEPSYVAGTWTRPNDWPDLDSLNVQFEGDTDVVYMTYDADAEVSAVAWHIDTKSSTQVTVEIGHIESGSFVPDASWTVNNNTNFIEWLDNYSGYVVVRITGKITHLYGINATRDGVTQNHRQQPMLERIAYVPNFIYMNYSANYSWGMWALERDKVGNGDGANLTNAANLYNECARLQSLDVSAFYTPNVTSLTNAFTGCFQLPELDLRHWVTAKVTNFSSMFYNCRSIISIDVRGWNTDKGTNFASMFYECRRLKEIKGLAGFDTSLATTLATMFYSCRSIKELPVEVWQTGNVTTLSGMFQFCCQLEKLDLHLWNVGKVTNLSSMFNECNTIKRINITGWETGTLTTVATMFNNCRALQEIDISGIIVTSACTNIYSMFAGCNSLKELVFPEWDVTGLGNGSNTANSVFANCWSLEKITGIADWDFRLTNSIGSMFNSCRSLKELDVSGWNVSTVTNMSSMFLNCWSLKTLDLSDWAPSASLTTLASMFQNCYSLRSIGDISDWNTSNVTTLASMFSECWSLQSISNISGWDVRKVTTCASMFNGCVKLKEITITNWNLALCTTIATMFRYCYALEKAVLTGWSIPKVTATAPGAFLGDCWNLKHVEIFPIPLNHSYAASRSLSHESLIRILQSLPNASGKTINLTATNVSRLSAAEKAIATAKGWTIAN